MLILKRKLRALGPHKTPILRLLPPLGCRWDHTRAFLSGSKRWGFPAEDITTTHLRLLPWSPATYKVLTSTCADQKMPNNSCKGTLRTAKNKAWRLGMYFLPLESGHFQPTSWEEASQARRPGLQWWTCSPEEPRCVFGSWKLLGPAERHIYNCFLLGENPVNAAFLEEKRLLDRLKVRATSLNLPHQDWTATCAPGYKRDQVPT